MYYVYDVSIWKFILNLIQIFWTSFLAFYRLRYAEKYRIVLWMYNHLFLFYLIDIRITDCLSDFSLNRSPAPMDLVMSAFTIIYDVCIDTHPVMNIYSIFVSSFYFHSLWLLRIVFFNIWKIDSGCRWWWQNDDIKVNISYLNVEVSRWYNRKKE